MKPYNPAVAVVMRLIKQGKITTRDAGDVLSADPKTIKSMMKEHGIETVSKGVGVNRREAAEANKKRNELLTTFAKAIKYDKADLRELSKEHTIPIRTLYRWVHRV